MPGRYILYYLRSIESLVESLGTGTTFKAISGGILRELRIPIAPLNEQKRIVAEIEKQFSRLDEAVTNLNRVDANLKRYKASVLKAAVEGKLTEQWRKEHPDVEPADKLLNRILTERRQKWEEAELAKMKEKGIEPKDDHWKERYKEPFIPSYAHLPSLPSGWHWVTSDQVFGFVTSGSRGWAKYYSETGPIFLRVGNLDHDSITPDLENVQHVEPPKGAEGTRTRIESNDILISITADVGMIALAPDDFHEAYINQHISLARPVGSVNSKYLAWYLAARPGQKQFQDLQRGATKAGLGLDDIRSVNVPLPSMEEQEEIVSEIERWIGIIDKSLRDIDLNLKRAERLRQSILKKAFSGKLVPQDPDDEPAKDLLARIRIERGKHEIELKRQKKKEKQTMKTPGKPSHGTKRDLIEVLKEANRPLKPEELFSLAGYKAEEVEEFYSDLKMADKGTLISQVKKKNGEVYLKAAL